MDNIFEDYEMIYSYSRQNALDDGVLIDITEIAHHSGFKVPVAINSATYSLFLDENRELILYKLQLFLASIIHMVRISEAPVDRVFLKYKDEDIVAHIGGGDDGEPVMTICFPIDL